MGGNRQMYVRAFLSTLSLRRATSFNSKLDTILDISIHALLAESDLVMARLWLLSIQFLSTLSLRRATSIIKTLSGGILYFYPRSPCGERLVGVAQGAVTGDISIHALLAESDYLATW